MAPFDDPSANSFDYKEFLANVSEAPGVYRMYNQADDIIYVGKAKNLFKRLSSYFRKNLDNEKTKALVSHIVNIDVTVTHTETEALILEHNYIKQYRPKYNVLLRDDKSYPYILLTSHKHPRLVYHRGAKKKKGDYFGPYPNAGAVRETLHLLQKIIPVRQCEDSVYANRTRPCLMYQIERCSAPCVAGLIDEQDYAEHVNYVRLFLQGKDNQVLNALIEKMDHASQNLHFEQAAKFRDQIQAIRRVQEQQSVSDGRLDDVDVIGFATQAGEACVHVLMIRQGKVLGSRSHFPKIPSKTSQQEVFSSFLHQYYLNHNDASSLPSTIIYQSDLSLESSSSEEDPSSNEILQQALSEISGRKIQFSLNPRGIRARYLKLANTNANSALSSKINHKMSHHQRVKALESALKIAHIGRMECFDISHTMGENTVASCVVFNREGPVKQEYRRYNIEGITGGDDYAAMAQVLDRRYAKQMYQDEQHLEKIPDIIFIDGGKGQLNRAHEVIQQYWELWPKRPTLIGIAKGVTRKHGLETMITIDGDEFNMPTDSPALHLIQHIRDESHDHAISGHRARRGKARTVSPLEGIEGVGVKRRQALLKHMGGMQELKRATIEEIRKVPGISKTLAEIIHEALKD